MSEPFIVHAHIPKTGGSALNRQFLFPRHGAEQVYQLYRYVFERSSRLPLRHVSRAMRSYGATGHVPFGFFDRIYPDAVYVSVFREPEARFLSFLNFVLANPGHKVLERIPAPLVHRAEQDPDAFVTAILDDARLKIVQSNVQTRLAAGMARLGDTPVVPEDLPSAIANLAGPRYLAGNQADLDGLIARLHAEMPAPIVRTPKPSQSNARLEKRLGHRIALSALAPQTRARLRDANALDLRLYERVLSPKLAAAA